MRLKKRFPLGGDVNFELMAEVLNVFDNINFNHGGPTATIQGGTSLNPSPNNGEDTFRVTSAYTDINTTFDPGGRDRPVGLESELVIYCFNKVQEIQEVH